MTCTMDLLRSNLSRVRIPEPTNRIYKQECCLSFDTPVTCSPFLLLLWLPLLFIIITFFFVPSLSIAPFSFIVLELRCSVVKSFVFAECLLENFMWSISVLF